MWNLFGLAVIKGLKIQCVKCGGTQLFLMKRLAFFISQLHEINFYFKYKSFSTDESCICHL